MVVCFSQEVMEKHLAAFKDRAAKRKKLRKQRQHRAFIRKHFPQRGRRVAQRRAKKQIKELLKLVRYSMKQWDS